MGDFNAKLGHRTNSENGLGNWGCDIQEMREGRCFMNI